MTQEKFAWSLVLEHGDYIDKISRKLFRAVRSDEDRDEAKQELILHLVEHIIGAGARGACLQLEGTRDVKARVQSWIYFQAMAVQKKLCRQYGKKTLERSGHREMEDGTFDTMLDFVAAGDVTARTYNGFGSDDAYERVIEQRDAKLLAAAVIDQASPKERDACFARMRDLADDESVALFNMNKRQVTSQIASLRDRLSYAGTCARARDLRHEVPASAPARAPEAETHAPVQLSLPMPAHAPVLAPEPEPTPVSPPSLLAVPATVLWSMRIPSRDVLHAVVGAFCRSPATPPRDARTKSGQYAVAAARFPSPPETTRGRLSRKTGPPLSAADHIGGRDSPA